jgi:hypothetical protein
MVVRVTTANVLNLLFFMNGLATPINSPWRYIPAQTECKQTLPTLYFDQCCLDAITFQIRFIEVPIAVQSPRSPPEVQNEAAV